MFLCDSETNGRSTSIKTNVARRRWPFNCRLVRWLVGSFPKLVFLRVTEYQFFNIFGVKFIVVRFEYIVNTFLIISYIFPIATWHEKIMSVLLSGSNEGLLRPFRRSRKKLRRIRFSRVRSQLLLSLLNSPFLTPLCDCLNTIHILFFVYNLSCYTFTTTSLLLFLLSTPLLFLFRIPVNPLPSLSFLFYYYSDLSPSYCYRFSFFLLTVI